MDFQWVDIGKVPDYWRAIRGVLLKSKMLKFRTPSATGIYTGLNVAVNWDKVDIKGPVYISGKRGLRTEPRLWDRGASNCWVCGGASRK